MHFMSLFHDKALFLICVLFCASPLVSAVAQESDELFAEETPLLDQAQNLPPKLAQTNYLELSQAQQEAFAAIKITDVIPQELSRWAPPVVPPDFPLPGMDLEVTCANQQTQAHILAGIHYIHLSWDRQALRHFITALKLDSRAPLAWWGVAMCILPENNEFKEERNKAMDKLKILRNRCDHPWEVTLIDSLLVFPNQDVWGTISELDKLLELKPEDLNAQLLKIIFLDAGHDVNGNPTPSLKQAQNMVWQLRQTYGDHPLVLRYELLVRFPAPQKTLPKTTGILNKISPALRSPWLHYEVAQLAYALGRYEQAQQLCEQGRQKENEWMQGTGAFLEDAPTLAKLTELEVMALLELGQVKRAQRLAEEAAQLSINDKTRTQSAGHLALLHHTSMLPSLIEERFENWQRALQKLPDVPSENADSLALGAWIWQARRYYYSGELAAQNGDINRTREANLLLNDHLKNYQQEVADQARKVGAEHYWVKHQRVMDQQIKFLFSRINELSDDRERALLHIRNAIEAREIIQRRPPSDTPRQPRQHLGYLALKWGDTALAQRAFNQALQNASVNQATAWLGLAEAFYELRDARAGRALQAFDAAWKNADRDHPLLLPYWNRAALLREKINQSSPNPATAPTPVSATP